MPAPIAHVAVGAAIYFGLPKRWLPTTKSGQRWLLFLCLVLAIAPDLDFLPGILLGEPNRFHQGISHSLFVCGLIGLLIAMIIQRHCKKLLPGAPHWAVLFCCVAAVASHPILDTFALDTQEPYGVPLFWPFTERHVAVPWPFFWDIQRSGENTGAFLQSLISGHNFRALFREVVFALTLLSAMTLAHHARKRSFHIFLGMLGACIGSLFLFLHPVVA